MKKSDIGVVVVFYAICAFFYAQTLLLKADSQTYPKFTIVLLFGLTTLYLLQMAVKARRYGVQKGRDEAFEGFLPGQFLVCLGAAVLYLIGIYYIGFYISTVIFMAALLRFLKVPYLHTVIAVAAVMALIYFAFARFLGVRLPVGELVKALR